MPFYIERFKDREKKEFDVEVITPLFLGGADPKKAELRVPSIKGALRFWWRAMYPDLSLTDLKEKEAQIFGDAGVKYGKSRVQITLRKSLEYDGKGKENPVPHKKVKFAFPCFYPGDKFALSILGNDALFNLFHLMSILGGLGKRSRRGFGSFRIIKVDGKEFGNMVSAEQILALFKRISGSRFRINKGKIIRTDKSDSAYPYIETIEIGEKSYRNYSDLLEKIGQSSHSNNSDYTGYAKGQERFSSPVYVSVIRQDSGDYRPIVTTLHTAFKHNDQKHGVDSSVPFKQQILSGGQK